MAIDIDLALSNVHLFQSSLFKSHRGCAYTVSEVYPIFDFDQTGQIGKEDEKVCGAAEKAGAYIGPYDAIHEISLNRCKKAREMLLLGA